MSSHGLSQFSARKVARKIDYSIGTIYNIFESHHDLILHINAATLDEMYEHIASQTNNDHPKTIIKQLATAYIEYATKTFTVGMHYLNLTSQHINHFPIGIKIKSKDFFIYLNHRYHRFTKMTMK